MIAEVTYNAGRSYRLKQYRFLQGKTVLVKDADVIRRCQATAGFAVQILKPNKAGKVKSKASEIVAVKTVGTKEKVRAPEKRTREPVAPPKKRPPIE